VAGAMADVRSSVEGSLEALKESDDEDFRERVDKVPPYLARAKRTVPGYPAKKNRKWLAQNWVAPKYC